MFEKVFVTIGTTSFESLIQLVVSDEAVNQFKKWGVKTVKIQGGKNKGGIAKDCDSWSQDDVQFEIYDYKESITDDMEWADLIICHAGAGTTIEALDLGKILIVVPNETLMDNHQIELAEKLRQEGYAFMTTVSTFFEQVGAINPSEVKAFPPAKPKLFTNYLKEMMDGG